MLDHYEIRTRYITVAIGVWTGQYKYNDHTGTQVSDNSHKVWYSGSIGHVGYTDG